MSTSFVPFVAPGDSIADQGWADQTIAEVLAEKRQWWEEYVAEAAAAGEPAQTWKEALNNWLDTAAVEARRAEEWVVALAKTIDALGDRDA